MVHKGLMKMLSTLPYLSIGHFRLKIKKKNERGFINDLMFCLLGLFRGKEFERPSVELPARAETNLAQRDALG